LISVSIQRIQPNSQDTSNFYLANIYQAIADPNRPNIPTPSSPPPFSPPNYAVWVNTLWFLSLAISITCALLAMLLQQWARRYLKVTQSRYSLHKQARIRSFFAEGVEKSFLPLAVEALPTLLHVSLFLFFAGLVVFLWNVHLTIFKSVLSWVGLCTALYGCITVVPIFHHDSPYYTPLTPLARLVLVVILRALFVIRHVFLLVFCTCCCHLLCCCSIWRWLIKNDQRDLLEEALDMALMTPEQAALNSPPEIDTRAFMWTFDRLDEDHELERFFSSLPDFRCSKVVHDPLLSLTEEQKEKLSQTLFKFLDLTFSSDLLSEAAKSHRAIMCAKALDLADFSHRSRSRFCDAVFQAYYRGPRPTTILGAIANDSREEHAVFVQAMVSAMTARPQQRDDPWFMRVVPNALGIQETVLRDHATNGDSLSLAILNYVTCQQFVYFWYSSWPKYDFRAVLEAASKFNAQDTSPELQHEFCALWNQIVLKAQKDNDRTMAWYILRPIHHIYIALHHGTDSAPTHFSSSTHKWDKTFKVPSSYPMCNVAGHVDDTASTSFSRTLLHITTSLVPVSLAGPDALPSPVPSSPVPVTIDVIESPTDAPSFDDFHPAQTTTEGLRVPVTSADLATTSVIRDFDTSSTRTLHSASDTSTLATHSSSPPPATVAVQHNLYPLTHSDPPNLPSLSSCHTFLDDTLPIGSSSSDLLNAHSDTSLSFLRIPSLGNSHHCSQRFSGDDLCTCFGCCFPPET
jgi:hypothetical protein